MPSIDPIIRGARLNTDAQNKLIQIAKAASEPRAPGVNLQTGTGGTTFEVHGKTLVQVFQLTEDQQYPDAQTPPDELSTLPDVPYAENCKAVWLDSSTNTYGINGSPDETVYFPTITDFETTDDPLYTSGDRVQATWDAQAGRWHAQMTASGGGGGGASGVATVIRCLVNQSTVAITDETFLVDSVGVVSPDGAAAPTVTSVNNAWHVPSAEDKFCIAFKNGSEWDGLPESPMETVSAITSIGYDDTPHQFDASTTDVVVFSKAAEASPVAWHSAELVTHVITVEKVGTALKYNTEDTYALETGSNPQTATWETLTTVDPVTDIDYVEATSHTFNKKETRGVEVFSSDGAGTGWTEDASWTSPASNVWHTTTPEGVVTSVDKSSLSLRYQLEQTHALEAFDTLTNPTWHTLVTVDPITALQYDSSPSPGTFDQKETKNVQVFAVDNVGTGWAEDAAFATWHDTVLVTNIVRDIDLNGDDLRQRRYTANMLEALTDTGWDTWHATASC